MKTAISIPDNIYEIAEQLSKRLNISRSALYTNAISAYIREHRGDRVTNALNEIYNKDSSLIEPEIESLQYASLSRDEW